MKKLNLWISAVFVLLTSVACSHESDLGQVRQDESQKSGINFELSGDRATYLALTLAIRKRLKPLMSIKREQSMMLLSLFLLTSRSIKM